MNYFFQSAGLVFLLASASVSAATVNIGGQNVFLSTPKGYIDCDKVHSGIFRQLKQWQEGRAEFYGCYVTKNEAKWMLDNNQVRTNEMVAVSTLPELVGRTYSVAAMANFCERFKEQLPRQSGYQRNQVAEQTFSELLKQAQVPVGMVQPKVLMGKSSSPVSYPGCGFVTRTAIYYPGVKQPSLNVEVLGWASVKSRMLSVQVVRKVQNEAMAEAAVQAAKDDLNQIMADLIRENEQSNLSTR